jgi:CRP-like cAMP-binding protein
MLRHGHSRSAAVAASTQSIDKPPEGSLHTVQNNLIESLPRTDRLRLLVVCEPVQLVLSQMLCERAERTHHVYFPTGGFISLVESIAEHEDVEVGMVGSEGMVGVHLTLGVEISPLRALAHGPGTAWRISAKNFRTELARSDTLRRNLNRYVYVLMGQLATAAACMRFHLVGPRLARWLLMCQDRVHADTFHVTQDLLADLLGVRRPGISVAAAGMQRDGLIEYKRGELKVLDRLGLEAVACTCYQSDRQAYGEQL